jgi:hypothetical protein
MPADTGEPTALEMRAVGAVVKAVFFRGRRGGPWDPPLGLDVTEVRFRGNLGARLHGWHSRHPAPRGIVVLAHPDRRYGKQWFAREGWLSWLRDQGFDALCFDFAVYGASSGGSAALHEDVEAACRLARRLRPGLPVHLVGLSIGAFASLNAAPRLDFLESLTLESPYPTFEAWYGAGRRRTAGHGAANALLARLFPRVYRRIDAGANAARVAARRVLVLASRADEVTPVGLTREVAARLPADRTRLLEVDGVPHLGLFQRAEVRDALRETLVGTRPGRDAEEVLAPRSEPFGARRRPEPALSASARRSLRAL